jgi:hypothetical protein
MNIREVIAVMNQMEAASIVERYAIGGAVGATFYLEPVATLDVDIFVSFRSEPGRLILNPQPVFDYLTAQGQALEGEYVVIAGWPVQFLPPTSPLVEEALRDAVTQDVAGVPARVFTAEHLAAQKTRRVSCSSSKLARLTRPVSKRFSPGTVCWSAGDSLNDSF